MSVCGCWRCHEETGTPIRVMILCSTCGNKRCPKANDHDNACTGSNEPGQAGSAYEHGSWAASMRRDPLLHAALLSQVVGCEHALAVIDQEDGGEEHMPETRAVTTTKPQVSGEEGAP